MSGKFKKSKGPGKVSKGAPSGFIISLAFHAVAFFVAGLFVVFTVLPKAEPEFKAPPPVERPKMKLKKPKVKVKKSSQPKPSSRIVAKVKSPNMPEIQLPDLMGTGEGLLGGMGVGGEFMDLPEIGEMTVFGGDQSIGNDLEVTFYSMAMNKDGSASARVSQNAPEFFALLREYVKSGWKKTKLSSLYQSPKKRYATTIMIPFTSSILGPAAFGEDINFGYSWIALYEGKLVHKDGITFRFWGASDDILTVAVDGEVVLGANFPWTGVDAWTITSDWISHAPGSRSPTGSDGSNPAGNTSLVGGDWITLEPGVPRDFKAFTGEGPGGEFFAYLLIEVKGEKYPLNEYGGRTYPMFATEVPTWDLEDVILENLYDGEANVTNVTTIFKDY